MPDETSLLTAAASLAEAERRSDVGALERLLATNYRGFDPAGRPLDREGVLQAYRSGGVRLTSLTQSALQGRVVREVGLVTGINLLRGRHGADQFGFRLRFLDVYAWQDERWQLIASQDTRLPG